MTATRVRDADIAPPPVHRRRRVVVIGAAVVVLAAFLTWLVAFSPVFGVGTVDVRGTHALTRAQIVDTAAIASGTPLVRLDTAAVTARLEKLPGVASAQVTTSFPSTVRITVVERVAVGFVVNGGRTQLIDRTGLAFRTVTTRPAGLLQLDVPGGAGSRSTVAAVADVAGSFPAALRARVKSIQALDPSSITLVVAAVAGDRTRSDKIVRWGSDARNADKARVVVALARRNVDQIDVTDPDQPFTRHS